VRKYLVSVIGSEQHHEYPEHAESGSGHDGPGMVKALMKSYYAIVYVIFKS